MRFKKVLALLAAILFAATATACASIPVDDETSSSPSSRQQREVPHGYY